MRKTRNYLSRGVAADEFVEDLLGFGWQFCGGFGVSVILAGKVERNVLLAELGHQEGSEGTQSIWGKRGNVITHVCVAVIKASGCPPGHENDCAWCFFAGGGRSSANEAAYICWTGVSQRTFSIWGILPGLAWKNRQNLLVWVQNCWQVHSHSTQNVNQELPHARYLLVLADFAAR